MPVCVCVKCLNYSVGCVLCSLVVPDIMAPAVAEHYELRWLHHLLCTVLKLPLSPSLAFRRTQQPHILLGHASFAPHLSPTTTLLILRPPCHISDSDSLDTYLLPSSTPPSPTAWSLSRPLFPLFPFHSAQRTCSPLPEPLVDPIDE